MGSHGWLLAGGWRHHDSRYVGWGEGWAFLDVDRRFLGEDLRCTMAVARDFGRYLCTASAVRPGHVAKKFFLIACVQLEIGGLKHARFKKSLS
jgi:hypothetical protein